MTDNLTAQCREVLLKMCWDINLSIANEYGALLQRHVVDVDDAAACMARALRARFHDTSASLEVALRAAAKEAP